MKISVKDVEYVARLSRLDLTEEEKEYFASQLGAILDYIEQLNRLDTNGVPPTSHPVRLSNVFRKDEALPSIDPEEVFKNAPDRHGNTFKVPRILEG